MNEKEWDVSVIIPCYNAEAYIEKTIDSLYAQTYKNFEVVFINDGSTDGTITFLQKCHEKWPERTQIITVENGGPSRARNLGLDKATGKYIIFLDSDDYVANDYIETLYFAAEKNNSEMVLSGQKKVDEDGNVIASIDYPVDQAPNCVSRRLNMAGKLYKKIFLNQHNIRFSLGKLYEDNVFNFLAMFLCENIVILPYNGYCQVIHPGSRMTRTIQSEDIPYEELEGAISYITAHKELISEPDVFEFTVLSFFTYFIFMANRKQMYALEKRSTRKSSPAVLKELCKYTLRVIPQYFPKYYKNPYVGIFKCRYLSMSQRGGVWFFVKLMRVRLLWPFVRMYYLF